MAELCFILMALVDSAIELTEQQPPAAAAGSDIEAATSRQTGAAVQTWDKKPVNCLVLGIICGSVAAALLLLPFALTDFGDTSKPAATATNPNFDVLIVGGGASG